MSSGNFTKEIVIKTKDGKEIYESSPEGFTVSLKEPKKNNLTNKEINSILLMNQNSELTQEEFDKNISSKFGSDISTALSLAHIRYLSHKNGFKNQQLHKFISTKYNKIRKNPTPIAIF
ncbi:MAG: hypothetical protein ACTSW3_09005 [Promethearchaeota archaeon]